MVCLMLFLIKIVTRFEKDDFTKISVSPTRNTHFQGFESSEFDGQSMKNLSKKENAFWSAVLMHF